MRRSGIVLMVSGIVLSAVALSSCADLTFYDRDAHYAQEAQKLPKLRVPKGTTLKRGRSLYTVPAVQGPKETNPSIVPPGTSNAK